MRAQFEKIPPPAEASFFVLSVDGPRFEHPFHFHPELELTLIVESTGRRFVGDQLASFGPGDLVLLGPNLPHFYHNDPPTTAGARARAVVVQFRADFLGPGFLEVPEMAGVARLLTRASRGLNIGVGDEETRAAVAERLLALARMEPGAARLVALLDILRRLAEARGEFPALSGEGFLPALDRADEARVDRVLRFINARFTGPLTQPEAAVEAGLSPAAFSRFFHRCTGRTFAAFVNELRVSESCRLLLETDRTVADICYACGYENLSNFNRRFRELKSLSPREYRRRGRGTAGEPWRR